MRAAATAALLAASIAGVAGVSVDRAMRLEIEPRVQLPDTAAHRKQGPLPLRLVDFGGVGIPTDTAAWGHDYSHNAKTFHRLILRSAPYVAEDEFRRLRADWTTYVRRMAAYGSNGIVVPLFLELVTFDRLPAVYAGTDFARRHRVVRDRFRELFAIARRAGIGVYLSTDMAALTPPLERYLRHGGALDPTDPALWAAYRAAFDEVFEQLPDVRGVFIRIGEAGPLYNRSGWDYRSEFLVGSVAGLRTMLRELLPAFEAHDRLLLLRSWTVGVGDLGNLHTSPATYDRALDDIASPNLVISTKLQAGDFFRFLPLNPTLVRGPQKRVIEFQARREFEGLGALPDYVGPLHARALAVIRSATPNVVGSWLWTQNGGPLRASPMSLYPLHGFWLWSDANAYATARLALDPDRSPADLAREWVRRELTTDSAAVEALTELLLLSPEAIEQGFYIRQFASRRVTFGGFELPPLLWIMEWNIVGGWSAVWSTIYHVAKSDLPAALADGFTALATVARMRAALERARPALTDRPALLAKMERSLAYEASLLDALAWYRVALLQYYRWLDTGAPDAYRAWHDAAPEFRRRAEAHLAGFSGDLDFPAFDFAPALAGLGRAEQGADGRWLVRGALALIALGFMAGAAARTAIVVAGLTVAVGAALSFSSPWAVGAVPGALGTFSAVLVLGLTGFHRKPGRTAAIAAGVSPLVWVALALLAAMSLRGPYYLWYLLWSGGSPRIALVVVLLGVPLWTLLTAGPAASRATGRAPSAAAGSVLMALGAALALLASLAPGFDRFLSALDTPLGLVPMTHAVVLGVLTYTRLPQIAVWYPVLIGGLIVAGGLLAWRTRPQPPS